MKERSARIPINLPTDEQQFLDETAGNLVKEGCVAPANTEVHVGYDPLLMLHERNYYTPFPKAWGQESQVHLVIDWGA